MTIAQRVYAAVLAFALLAFVTIVSELCCSAINLNPDVDVFQPLCWGRIGICW